MIFPEVMTNAIPLVFRFKGRGTADEVPRKITLSMLQLSARLNTRGVVILATVPLGIHRLAGLFPIVFCVSSAVLWGERKGVFILSAVFYNYYLQNPHTNNGLCCRLLLALVVKHEPTVSYSDIYTFHGNIRGKMSTTLGLMTVFSTASFLIQKVTGDIKTR